MIVVPFYQHHQLRRPFSHLVRFKSLKDVDWCVLGTIDNLDLPPSTSSGNQNHLPQLLSLEARRNFTRMMMISGAVSWAMRFKS